MVTREEGCWNCHGEGENDVKGPMKMRKTFSVLLPCFCPWFLFNYVTELLYIKKFNFAHLISLKCDKKSQIKSFSMLDFTQKIIIAQ